MAITRKNIRDIFPEATDENISALLSLFHTEIDPIKDELETAKKELGVERTAKEKAEKDFEDFKTAATARETREAKTEAFKKLLVEAGVGEKHQKLIVKASDIDAMELNKDGTLKGKSDLLETVKKDYADYITEVNQQGAHVANPPAGGSKKPTKEEILAIKDTGERQRAMTANHELFGI